MDPRFLPDGSPAPVVGTLPDRAAVEALVARRVNPTLAPQGQDWRERWALRPIVYYTTGLASGRPYGARHWGVMVDGRLAGYVAVTRAGRMRLVRTAGGSHITLG